MRAKALLIVSAAGLLFALAFALLAAPASALTISGDWTVSGVESYQDDTITVTVNASGTGNLFILPGGELHLNNITLILPNNRTLDNQGYLEVRNSTLRGPNWFFYLRSGADLSNVAIHNASRNTGGGLSGTVITNSSVNLNNVRWDYFVGGFNQVEWQVHVRVIMDFKNNFIGRRGQLSYELPTISNAANIDISGNRFQLGVGFMGFDRTDGLVITNALHSGAVTYDIHNNNFTDGNDHIHFGSSTLTTTYLIHDNTFGAPGSTAIEIGDGATADRFDGVVRVWNCTITEGNRALRMFGAIGEGIVGTADNITVIRTGTGNPDTGIVANSATWEVRNSTIGMRGNDTQYQAESNGHIKIWDTADRALTGTEVTQSGASVEHFAFLNLDGAHWQNSVQITNNLVGLREAAGNLSLTMDPQNWSARDIVWWGRYFNAPQVDNRDLRPEINDAGHAFPCTPTPFLVTVPMAPISIVCTDNFAPVITVVKPTANFLQNSSTLMGNGSGTEYGSGLNTFDWSLDNASWGPVTLGPGALDWRMAAAGLTDGTYTLYLRAVDRTGLAGYRSVSGLRIDLTPPTLTIPELVNFTTDFLLNISGSSEALARITYVLGAAQPVTTTADGTGAFAFPNIALSEGHNTLWVTAVDSAGNQFSLQRNITVDTVAPALRVDQSQYILTAIDFVEISGMSEASATVLVNGIAAARAGGAFTYQLSLAPGITDITVTATDAAGNQAAWFGRAVSDSDSPTIIASIITGNVSGGIPVTRVGAVPVTGTITDATSGVALVTINGKDYVIDGAGGLLVSLVVPEGLSEVRISATDFAGNVATKTLSVIRDSTAPSGEPSLEEADAPLVQIGGAYFTRGDFVIVSLFVDEDGEATVAGDTRAVTSGANLFNVSLHEGGNTISVTFKDAAGNAGAPRSLGITRDKTPPPLSFTTPQDGAALDEAVTQVSGVAEAGATVTVNGHAVILTGNGFTTTVPVPEGETTTITAVATDAMGNTATQTISVTRHHVDAVQTPTGDSMGSVLFLVLGAAAGVAAGFLIRGKSKAAEKVERAELSTVDQPAQQAQAAEPARKGPRGPSPP